LTSEPHGSIVAAPTFGLPEEIGGQRNWIIAILDSRRVVHSLRVNAPRLHRRNEGIHALDGTTLPRTETGQAAAGDVSAGRPAGMPEHILRNCEGYRQSKPVRIGNGAGGQLQLDIYGELMDAVLIYDKHGEPISYDFG